MIMKTNKLFLAFLMAATLLVGCEKTYKEDYTVSYKELLDYTLGDWKVVDTRQVTYEASTLGDSTEHFTAWEIQYFDSNAKTQILEIGNNYNNLSVLRRFDRSLNARFEQELLKALPDLPETKMHLRDTMQISTAQEMAYAKDPDLVFKKYKDILKLKDFTFQQVFENSPYYLTLQYEFPDKGNGYQEANEKQLKVMEEATNKIIDLIPNVNLIYHMWGDGANWFYYIDGKQIDLNEYPQFHKSQYDGSELNSEQIYWNIVRNQDNVKHFDVTTDDK
jgi:hypothetical protein